MGFADPQTITAIAGGPTSLPRTSLGVNSVEFTSNDGTVKLSASSSYNKRTRRVIRLQHQKIAADPLISSTDILYNMTCSVVFDVPKTGYTVAQQKEVGDALVAYLSASTGARLTQLLGGEN